MKHFSVPKTLEAHENFNELPEMLRKRAKKRMARRQFDLWPLQKEADEICFEDKMTIKFFADSLRQLYNSRRLDILAYI